MNYEQKYKFAIEQAKKELDACGSMDCDAARQIFRLFPELAESKDERIKKEIIRYLDRKIISSNFGGDIATFKEWIAWLEKQGEQANKIEPKFKVGDFIVYNNSGDVCQVTEIRDDKYCIWPLYAEIEGYLNFIDVDNDYHLWTIQDAKDGDVLSTKKGNPFIYDKNRYNNGLAYYYAAIDANEELTLKNPHNMLSHFGELRSVFPATKEQRDFLFQKMKEAGYKWDNIKKELIRYE